MSLISINNTEYSKNIDFAAGSLNVFDTDLGASNTISIIPIGDKYIEYKPRVMFEDRHHNQSFREFTEFDPVTRKWTYSEENTTADIVNVYIYGFANDYLLLDTSNLINCKLANNSPNYFILPDSFYTPINTFIIEPLEGYTLPNPPILKIVDNGVEHDYDFVLQDNKYIIFTQFQHYDVESVQAIGQAIEKDGVLSEYGLIRVYKTDKTINQSLVTHRFSNGEDLGQYIYSFVRYPFFIEPKNNANIYLGVTDTGINSPLIPKQIHTLSLGKKLINGLYKDTRDINNVEIVVILPFYGLYNIDTRYINTEIEIKYVIDILSNTAVIELYSNDVLFNTIDCYIGYSIPYIIQQGYINHNITLQNNITKQYIPKIILKQNNQINNGIYKTYKPCVIGDVSEGFIKCQNVELNVNHKMTLSEQQIIESYLNTGIYI